MTEAQNFAPNCPFPFEQYPHVVMAHGGGGRLMKRLLDELIVPTLNIGTEIELHDAAVTHCPQNHRIAMTTDSFVVKPMAFPGGDIGSLSVYGTVNDLVMAGAKPAFLSLGLIIEEGLEMKTLWQFMASIRQAADKCGVRIVTGDTKVVDRGKGDGLFINTAGIGFVPEGNNIHPQGIHPDDSIIVSGDLGRHGIAIMTQREGLQFESEIESDCASLIEPVQCLLDAGVELHCLRDLTRGGLSSALNELAEAANVTFALNVDDIPISGPVSAACELLGLDPLYVACEGRFVGFVPNAQAQSAIDILRSKPNCESAQIIGQVRTKASNSVILQNAFGSQRVLDMLSGEQLPRIC